MIHNIDFLPASYHQLRQKRKRAVVRRSACIVFMALIAMGIWSNYRHQLRLVKTRDALRKRADRMYQALEEPAALMSEVERLDMSCDLITQLQLRIPPSRVLATVVNSLPEYVSLTEIQLASEVVRKASRETDRQPSAKKKGSKPGGSRAEPAPIEEDLAKIESVRQSTVPTVYLTGLAPDDIEISGYLACLEATGLFTETRLQYADQTRASGHEMRSFAVMLYLRSPHELEMPQTAEPRDPEQIATMQGEASH